MIYCLSVPDVLDIRYVSAYFSLKPTLTEILFIDILHTRKLKSEELNNLAKSYKMASWYLTQSTCLSQHALLLVQNRSFCAANYNI